MDPQSLDSEKRALRARMRSKLAGVGESSRKECGELLARRVASWEGWEGARIVLSFLSMASEIDTSALHLAALASGKQLGLPRVAGPALLFHRVSDPAAAFGRGSLGVREPSPDLPEIATGTGTGTLVLVPALALDRFGRRLGRGGGFYDRFLASLPHAVRIGLCYDFQLVERVPSGHHDLGVEWIATDRRLLRCPPPPGSG